MSRWARKPTFEPDADDWVVLRDGLMVGRVMLDAQQTSRQGCPQWMWTVITMPARSGTVATLEVALEKVRQLSSHLWAHQPHGWPIEGSRRA